MNEGHPSNSAEKPNDFPLVRRPSSAVDKAAPGAKRILAGMVADTLALTPARTNAEAEGWFAKGYSYFESENYTEAVEWYRKAADQGFAPAQFNLGYCYAHGQGVPQDFSEAPKWYRKAADQGFAPAQFNVGYCYANGRGVPQDFSEAAKWYRKAADEGYARAQSALGYCYANGQGVPQDPSEAAKWDRKAADQGFAPAQSALGYRYANGQGVPQDFSEAAKWYRKAADQGNPRDQESLGACYANGRVAIDIANGMEGAIDAYQYVKLAEEKGCEGAAKTVDVISALLSPEELREAERRYQELCSRRYTS
jgi:TPR repeat protein